MEVGLNTEVRAAVTEIPQGKPAGFIVPRGLRGDGQRVVSIFNFLIFLVLVKRADALRRIGMVGNYFAQISAFQQLPDRKIRVFRKSSALEKMTNTFTNPRE